MFHLFNRNANGVRKGGSPTARFHTRGGCRSRGNEFRIAAERSEAA